MVGMADGGAGGATATSTSPRGVSTRDALLDRAAEVTCGPGWSTITMAKLADSAGVSRQTVYNEFGSKSGLAEALVMRELRRFLAVVEAELASGDDVVDAIRRTTVAVLRLAADNPLLHAVLSASHGAGNDLLPLLTSHSAGLIDTASTVVAEHLERFALGLPEEQVAASIDGIVRLVLSHVMQPGGTPTETADQVAWLVSRVLAD